MARSTPRRRAERTRPWSRRERRRERRRETARSRSTPRPAPREGSAAAAPAGAVETAPPPAPTPTPPPHAVDPTAAPPPARPLLASVLLASVWLLVTLAGTALLVLGLFAPFGSRSVELGAGVAVELDADWLAPVGAVAVATAYVWALAARTGGRPVVFGLLTLVVGVTTLLLDRELFVNGAAVTTCVVSAVLAIVATVPAVGLRHTVREVLVATSIAAIGGLATVGLGPDIDLLRFQYVTLGLALVAAFGLVYRLGAGLHGLGRRGVFIVVVGGVVLAVTLLYAELLQRYGTPALVAALQEAVAWLDRTIGAAPRPIVALLGVPALVWGTHMRARRRQGWWVCVFGVGATVPLAQALLDPEADRLDSALGLGYGLLAGLVVGALLVVADLAVTGNRGRRGRRAETAAAVRPEPKRIEALL